MPEKNEVQDDFFGDLFTKAGAKKEDLEEVVAPEVEEGTPEVSVDVVPRSEYERMKGEKERLEENVGKYNRAIISLRGTCDGYKSGIKSVIEEGEENSK